MNSKVWAWYLLGSAKRQNGTCEGGPKVRLSTQYKRDECTEARDDGVCECKIAQKHNVRGLGWAKGWPYLVLHPRDLQGLLGIQYWQAGDRRLLSNLDCDTHAVITFVGTGTRF